MKKLRFVAVSDDGSELILSTHGNEKFVLHIDARVQAAIRGDRAGLGKLNIQPNSHITPRDIQARVRAGDSVEAVSAESGLPPEKVQRYAEPVLAERAYIVERAQKATLRHVNGDQSRTLESAAVTTASADGAKADHVEWDAWRHDSDRWHVRFAWPTQEDEKSALFSFDPAGRTVIPEDTAARAVAGIPTDEEEPAHEGAPVSQQPHVPTLSVVASTDLGDGMPEPADDETDDVAALREVALQDDAPAARRAARRTRSGRPERRRREPQLFTDTPSVEQTSERLRLTDIASNIVTEEHPVGPDDPAPKPAAQIKAPARRSSGRRPSVPSWDEIMFGRRTSD